MAKSPLVPPAAETLTKSISECARNGKALLDDADLLFGWDRFSTALALAILAQEEFAKAFLLQLVADGILPWAPEIRRSITRHECKHLLAIVMDWVPASDFDQDGWWGRYKEKQKQREQRIADYKAGKISADEFLAQLKADKDAAAFPETVAAALNIYRHEHLEALAKRYPWRDDEGAKGPVRKIADGALDAKKQSALFVDIGKTGAVTQHPGTVTRGDAEKEIRRAAALAESRATFSDEYYLLKEVLPEVFGNLQEQAPR
jgi:AbiV family abortive infection protein